MSSFLYWNARQRVVAELAETISTGYFKRAPIDPALIADEEGITYCCGYYQNAFDGLLHYQDGRFHIFLNLNRLEAYEKPRTRYTFGHELGHYFMDDHRYALQNGKTPSHPSFNHLFQKNPVEQEADYFASCLLMPSGLFRQQCYRLPLSETLLVTLANHFQTSISSVIFRYFNLNQYPMAIIISKNGLINRVMATIDFPFRKKPVKDSPVPPSTVAGEYFYQNKSYNSAEILYADDWFSDDTASSQQIFEKCYYIKRNSILSIIWKRNG
ncbi:ImmA/IrrE family metallo-endopeptidase [Larkinella bovis]|uniref:ImmA/IrrE family metallo-endopeptidase n=1 Tax=Larkinella bovis TaxID=683041 RepID=A0ABW0IBK8_9BACT